MGYPSSGWRFPAPQRTSAGGTEAVDWCFHSPSWSSPASSSVRTLHKPHSYQFITVFQTTEQFKSYFVHLTLNKHYLLKTKKTNEYLSTIFTLKTSGPITSCFRQVGVTEYWRHNSTGTIALKAHADVQVYHVLILGGQILHVYTT